MAFNFTDQYVRLPSVGFPATFSTGFTWAMVLRRTTSGLGYLWNQFDGAAVNQWRIAFDTPNTMFAQHPSGGFSVSAFTVLPADDWVLLALTHPGGVSPGRWHKCVLATGAWTHQAGTGGNLTNLAGATAGSQLIGRFASASSGFSVDGDYAFGGIYPLEMSDAYLESCGTLQGLLQPAAVSKVLFDGASIVDIAQNGVPSAVTATVSTASVPFGYGHPVEMDAPESGGGVGTALFDGYGYLTATGVGSIPIPDPPSGPGPGSGFYFKLVTPAQVSQDIHFTTTGDFTHDQNRSVRRAISGFRLLPSEAAKVDLARDAVYAFLEVNGESYPMGVFYFTESSRVKDAIIDDEGNSADIIEVSLADSFIRLMRSDEVPRTALAGADPSQEMIVYLNETGTPHSVTGAAADIYDDVTWSPFTTYEEIVSQLAELAGHRRPWADNYGVIRSVSSNVVDSEILSFGAGMDIQPIAGTIVVVENYLSAPNRVVVYDDQAAYPIVGAWDAPSSAPNSLLNRGWVLTAGVPQQGLSGPVHAQQVARTIGEQLSARSFSCQIMPTNRLDGPQVVRYLDALWLTESWSVSSAPGSVMSVNFRELLLEPGTQS